MARLKSFYPPVGPRRPESITLRTHSREVWTVSGCRSSWSSSSPCTIGVGPSVSPPESAEFDARVTEVVDGDTLRIRFADGDRDTVRLVGIDTPEIYAESQPSEFVGVPDTASGRDCLQQWGWRAKAYAAERLEGRIVGFAFDPNVEKRDAYDRLLAYVLVGNGTLNYDLVRSGYARVYETDFSRRRASHVPASAPGKTALASGPAQPAPAPAPTGR